MNRHFPLATLLTIVSAGCSSRPLSDADIRELIHNDLRTLKIIGLTCHEGRWSNESLEALVACGERAAPLLLEALSDPDPQLRENIYLTLIYLCNRHVISADVELSIVERLTLEPLALQYWGTKIQVRTAGARVKKVSILKTMLTTLDGRRINLPRERWVVILDVSGEYLREAARLPGEDGYSFLGQLIAAGTDVEYPSTLLSTIEGDATGHVGAQRDRVEAALKVFIKALGHPLEKVVEEARRGVRHRVDRDDWREAVDRVMQLESGRARSDEMLRNWEELKGDLDWDDKVVRFVSKKAS